jgi:hypothetical protein
MAFIYIISNAALSYDDIPKACAKPDKIQARGRITSSFMRMFQQEYTKNLTEYLKSFNGMKHL